MMDKYEIAILADDYHVKRQMRDYLAMNNVPVDPEAARKQAIEYHIADAECIEALMRLERAKHSLLTK